MSIIAVEKDAPGATSQLAAAANPDNVPNVEVLCVACKEGSSESHLLSTKVVSMIENDDDATNQLPTPTSGKSTIYRDSNCWLNLSFYHLVASCVITLHSLIREDNQDSIFIQFQSFSMFTSPFSFYITAGPSAFQPITGCLFHLLSLIYPFSKTIFPISGSQPFLTFPAIQEISTSKEILSLEIPPLSMSHCI